MAASNWGMEYFDNYLREKSFTLYTDHKPLENFSHLHTKTMNRLQENMLTYDFQIQYKKGATLDMIFSSKCNFVKSKSSFINLTFDDSDHAMVFTELEIVEITMWGPRLPRVDACILDKTEVKEKTTIKLDEVLNQIPINWDPTMILEFIKMSIRGIFSEER